MITGLYIAGSSPLHRLGAGAKLLGLIVFAAGLFLTNALAFQGAALILVCALYTVGGLGLAIFLRQLRAIAIVVLLVFAAQLWFSDPRSAVAICLRLGTLFLSASLLTLTTTTSDMVDAMERGFSVLRPFGVDPAKIALALSLAIRFVPVMMTVMHEVREAQRARGMNGNIVRLAVPVVIRALRMTDEIADAIDARR